MPISISPQTILTGAGAGLILAAIMPWAANRITGRMQREWEAIRKEFAATEDSTPEPPPVTRVTPRTLRMITVPASILVFAAIAWQHGLTPAGLLAAIMSTLLITGALIDIQEGLLPDSVTQVMLWAALLAAAFGINPEISASQALTGAAIGWGVMRLVSWVSQLTTGMEGLGQGDVKLVAAIGAWLGAPELIIVILISAVLGLLLAVILRMAGRTHDEGHISFGPALAAGAIIASLLPKGFPPGI